VVLQGKNMHEPNESLDSTVDISESPFSLRIHTAIEDTIADDVYATRGDHEEGIWEKV
jgi:hypothetical protein